MGRRVLLLLLLAAVAAAAAAGNCSIAVDCTACTEQGGCGWLAPDAVCVAGDSFGPFGPQPCVGAACAYQYATCSSAHHKVSTALWDVCWGAAVVAGVAMMTYGYRLFPWVAQGTAFVVAWYAVTLLAANSYFLVSWAAGGSSGVAYAAVEVAALVAGVAAAAWTRRSHQGRAGPRCYRAARRLVGSVAMLCLVVVAVTFSWPNGEGGAHGVSLLALLPHRALIVILAAAAAAAGAWWVRAEQRRRFMQSTAVLGSFLAVCGVDRCWHGVTGDNAGFTDAQVGAFFLIFSPHPLRDASAAGADWAWEGRLLGALFLVCTGFGLLVQVWVTAVAGRRHLSSMEAREASLAMPVDDYAIGRLRRRDPVSGGLVEMALHDTADAEDAGDDEAPHTPDAAARARIREAAMYRQTHPSWYERLRWRLGFASSAKYSPLVVTKTRPRGASAIDAGELAATYVDAHEESTEETGGETPRGAGTGASDRTPPSRSRSRSRRRGKEKEKEKDRRKRKKEKRKSAGRDGASSCGDDASSSARTATYSSVSPGLPAWSSGDDDAAASTPRSASARYAAGGDVEVSYEDGWYPAVVLAVGARHGRPVYSVRYATGELCEGVEEHSIRAAAGSPAATASPAASPAAARYTVGAAVQVTYGEGEWYAAEVLSAAEEGRCVVYAVRYATGELCEGVDEEFLRPQQ